MIFLLVSPCSIGPMFSQLLADRMYGPAYHGSPLYYSVPPGGGHIPPDYDPLLLIPYLRSPTAFFLGGGGGGA